MELQEVNQSKIEQVAHQFWVQRGSMGSPEEDWFRAEQQLRGKAADRDAPAAGASTAAKAAEA